jgi:hypothetical protein
MIKTWSLYKWQPHKDYPSVHYFWVNPEGIIKHTRSIEPYGYLPSFYLSDWVDYYFDKKEIEDITNTNGKVTKVKASKMTEEQLSQGILIL